LSSENFRKNKKKFKKNLRIIWWIPSLHEHCGQHAQHHAHDRVLQERSVAKDATALTAAEKAERGRQEAERADEKVEAQDGQDQLEDEDLVEEIIALSYFTNNIIMF
jgi:hypothetical protein